VRRFFELGAEGMGRNVRFVNLPMPVARGTMRVLRSVMRVLTGGKMSVVSSNTLSMVTRDNPFVSNRARVELGWAPSVRPETGVPDAFRWWMEQRAGR
jgi:nucleoside-diphosphate-sugar epimerase